MQPLHLPEADLARLSASISNSVLHNLPLQVSHVRGEDLPHLSPHRQLNHFVLMHVAQDLGEYVNRQDQPYVDSMHADVRAAREHYIRSLSHHIRLDRSQLQQLLERATYHSIRLLLDPLGTLDQLLFGNSQLITRASLERWTRYVVYFDFAVGAVVNHYRQQPTDTVAKADFFSKLTKAALLHAEAVQQPTLAYRQDCFRTLTGAEMPVAEPGAKATLTLTALPVDIAYRPSKLMARRGGLAANHLKTLQADGLPIHQQFTFVQRLFGGDTDRFRATLAHVNLATDYSAAIAYLERELITPDLRRAEPQVLDDLLDLIRARFEPQAAA